MINNKSPERHFMFADNRLQLLARMRETQQDFKLLLINIIAKSGVAFQSMDDWNNG